MRRKERGGRGKMGRRKRSTGRINLCTYLYYYVLYYYMASANNANGESPPAR